MKQQDIPAHEAGKALFEALNYSSGQIAAILEISPKAAQLKRKNQDYCKFTEKDLQKILAHYATLEAQKSIILSRWGLPTNEG